MRTTLTKHRRLALAAAASLALLAGCGDDEGSPTGAASGGHQAGTPTAPAAADFNDADVAFVSGMKPHHEQAVEMADMVLAAHPSAEVARLAKQIKGAQAPEIEQLDAMLKTFGADGGHNAPSAHGGMMTGDEMKALDAADGTEASRMFLEMMIKHHQGAIDAAKTEIDKGKHAPAKALAENIARTQAEEIETMRKLLADL